MDNLEWVMASWEGRDTVVLQGSQGVQKLRGHGYREKVIEEKVSEHSGTFAHDALHRFLKSVGVRGFESSQTTCAKRLKS